jgi:hypothetical protein
MQTTPHVRPKRGVNKLVLGVAAVVASAIVGTTGFAAATNMGNNKPSKQQCAAAGFKNYGQCVKEWAHNKNHPGGGYNGNVNANVNVNLELNNSNNNVIYVIIKPIIRVFQ